MESDRLRELLEKYWESDTSLEEEVELRQLIKKKTLTDEFKKEVHLFQFYDKQKNLVVGEKASNEIMGQLETPTNAGTRVVSWIWNSVKVAAVIIILITAGWLVRNEMRGTPNNVEALTADTFEDPNEAYAETKRAFEMLGRNLSKGRDQAAKLKAFNAAQQKARNLKDKEDKL